MFGRRCGNMLGVVHYTAKVKRYSPDKLVIFITAISLVTLMLGLVFNSLARNEGEMLDFYSVEVKAGDSVWECVKSVYGETEDIRSIVDETISMNGIKDGMIFPGMRLSIPVREAVIANEASFETR